MISCVRSWYLNDEVDSFMMAEEKFVRNGMVALRSVGRLMVEGKCMPWDLVGASRPQKRVSEFQMIHEQSLRFQRGEGPRPKPARERSVVMKKGSSRIVNADVAVIKEPPFKPSTVSVQPAAASVVVERSMIASTSASTSREVEEDNEVGLGGLIKAR